MKQIIMRFSLLIKYTLGTVKRIIIIIEHIMHSRVDITKYIFFILIHT